MPKDKHSKKRRRRRHRASRHPKSKPKRVPPPPPSVPSEEPADDPVQNMEMAKNLAFVQARLSRNTKVRTETAEYTVIREVSAGTFGFTYLVRQKEGNFYYLRTEPMTANPELRAFKFLKFELLILRKSRDLERSATEHFVRLYDSGCTDDFKFMVTQALGETLHDITRKQLHSAFSASTALRVSIQMLRALADLHQVGFVHRFVRPQAFAIGLGAKVRTVYLADCGLPWMYRDPISKAIRIPRKYVRMIGSLRYISHNVHMNLEQSRRDDLESWVYLSMEFFDLMCLPWRDDRESNTVMHKKRKFIDGQYPMSFPSSSLRYKLLLDYSASMKYHERPDYPHMQQVLQEIRAERGLNFDLPYDWENLSSQPPKQPVTQPIGQPVSDTPVEPKTETPTPTEPNTKTSESAVTEDELEEEQEAAKPLPIPKEPKPPTKKSPTFEEPAKPLPIPKKPSNLTPTQLPTPPSSAQAEVQYTLKNYVANTSIGNHATVDKMIEADMSSSCKNLADGRPKPTGTPKSLSENSPSSDIVLP
ncbi:Protein kinase domain-containing protein [Aphelenchoides besseyi]|nr:Protein kinase domain-containing protein [Aphelenchoides besseyi]